MSEGMRRARAGFAMVVAITAIAGVARMVPSQTERTFRGLVSGSLQGFATAPTSSQERILFHPTPSAPLAEKWSWAEQEASRLSHDRRWVAWSFDRALTGQIQVDEDSDQLSRDRRTEPPLGQLLFGASYRLPQGDTTTLLRPLIVLVHLRGDQVDRIALRSASIGMPLGGDPVYWLGTSASDQSLDWLIASSGRMATPELDVTLTEVIATHDNSGRVVPFLAAAIRSDRPVAVRAEAVEGLEWHPTPESVRVLRDVALSDDALAIRSEAAEALGEIRTPGAEAALIEVVRSAAPLAVRMEAVEAMGERESSPVVAELRRLAVDDPSEQVRDEAVDAIAERRTPATDAALLELVRSSAPVSVRLEAIEELGERGSSSLIAELGRLAFQDPSEQVQREAVDVLAEYPTPETVPILDRIIWEHPSSDIRAEATSALEDLPDSLALPLIRRAALDHPDPRVRDEARDALAELARRRLVPNRE